MKTFIRLTLVTLLFASCYSTLHLHQSGIYTIKERDGNATEFYEVAGKYTVVSDTLKRNDKIVINVIKAGGFKRSNKKKPDDTSNINTVAKD